jgi:hypothetical protein
MNWILMEKSEWLQTEMGTGMDLGSKHGTFSPGECLRNKEYQMSCEASSEGMIRIRRKE